MLYVYTYAKVDLTVLKEYKKREAEFDNRAKDVERVTEERDAQKAHYDGLRKQRLDEFMTGFNTISLKLKEMYQVCLLKVAQFHSADVLHFIDDHAWRQR